MYKPMFVYFGRGGEQIQQTSAASKDTKMTGKFLEKGAGRRKDWKQRGGGTGNVQEQMAGLW